jgi:hypothetical protein
MSASSNSPKSRDGNLHLPFNTNRTASWVQTQRRSRERTREHNKFIAKQAFLVTLSHPMGLLSVDHMPTAPKTAATLKIHHFNRINYLCDVTEVRSTSFFLSRAARDPTSTSRSISSALEQISTRFLASTRRIYRDGFCVCVWSWRVETRQLDARDGTPSRR